MPVLTQLGALAIAREGLAEPTGLIIQLEVFPSTVYPTLAALRAAIAGSDVAQPDPSQIVNVQTTARPLVIVRGLEVIFLGTRPRRVILDPQVHGFVEVHPVAALLYSSHEALRAHAVADLVVLSRPMGLRTIIGTDAIRDLAIIVDARRGVLLGEVPTGDAAGIRRLVNRP